MPKVRLRNVDFGADAMREMTQYLFDETRYWKLRTKNFRENVLKDYAKVYKGTPKEKVKNLPWPNAANNVIQLAATQCDQLLSRIMAIYMVDPLWPVKALGEESPSASNSADDQRMILEEFLQNCALDSEELDMYKTEQVWWSSTVRNGTGVIKIPYQYVEEQALIVGEAFDAEKSPKFRTHVKYDGPRPENVPLNRFVNNLNYSKLSDSPLFFEIIPMSKYDIQEKVHRGIWKQTDAEKVIGQPNRQGPQILQQWMLEQQGIGENISAEGSKNTGDEYDIIEAWFEYWHNGTKFHLCAQFHLETSILLRCFYNFYPNNMRIYEDAKLAYDDDQYLGYGLVEMLQGYQDEVSTTHNQRTDAGTLNNTTAFRVNKNTKLHSILTFYPGVMVPADKDEIERLDTSNPYAGDINSEQLTVAYAKERSGVDPAIGGSGGGTVNAKKGVYSAQGTFASLQAQNNRTSLRTSDMRDAHTRAGNKIATIYAHFGLGSRVRQYARKADALKKALESVKSGQLGLLIRPASASINKEMEKQNDILLSQNLERLYAGDAQIIQSLTTQGMPEDLKDYYTKVLKAKNMFMRHLLRNFGYPDIEAMIPKPKFLEGDNNVPTGGAPADGSQLQRPNPGVPTIPTGQGAASLPQ